jgi:hypothetical protein
MALPSSGSISLNQVNVELGNSGTATINMGSSAVRGLFDRASGSIGMGHGHGRSSCATGSWSQSYSNASGSQTGSGTSGEYEFTTTTSYSVSTVCSGVSYTLTGATTDSMNYGNETYVEFYNGTTLVHTSSSIKTYALGVYQILSVSGSFTGAVDNFKIVDPFWTYAGGGPCSWTSSGTLTYSA